MRFSFLVAQVKAPAGMDLMEILFQASEKQSREESINHLLINKWLPGP